MTTHKKKKKRGGSSPLTKSLAMKGGEPKKPKSPLADTVPPPKSEPVDPTPSATDDAKPATMRAADVAELEIDAIEPPPSSRVPMSGPPDDASVAERIRDLEARLDRMIDDAAHRDGPGDKRVDRTSSLPPPPASGRLPTDEGDPSVFDTARELLSTDYYLRKWGRLGMRNRSEEVDDFGFDPVYEEKVLPVFNFLYEKYFRVDVEGVGNIPGDGRCILVANHSGTLPFDGMMLKLAVKREHAQKRDVRWLAEDFIFHFPFLGSFTNRVGAVRACQENAERLLNQGALIAVFPEGVKGIGKLFRDRYKLQRFGRGGFVKLALRTKTPVIPVSIVGAEEASPMLFRIEYLTKAIGLPYFPVTPTFPLLGPAGLAPAPTKWKIVFGEPVSFDGHGSEAADDEILIGRLGERVRATIQGMLDRSIANRRSVWFG